MFCATLAHETSRFSPIPTNLDSYREAYLYLPSTGEGAHWRSQVLDDVSWSSILGACGHQIAFGLLASAQPSLPTNRPDYATLKAEITGPLEEALPVDAVLLQLHGAQVAEGTDDCTGDILLAVRRIVGKSVPMGVILDLHGNVSCSMTENADILLSCLEYPHTDTPERARQLAQLIVRAARRDISPVMSHRRVPMLGTYYTTASPMREFVAWAKSFEDKDGILGVSLMHGFAPADVTDCGAAVLVCADGDRRAADELAQRIAARYFELRDEIRGSRLGAKEAVTLALAEKKWPVVIADTTDNPGGGAAGDSTWLLHSLIDAAVSDCAVGMVWDPMAVQFAHKAGVGARLALRVGGKCGSGSGAPVDGEATVLACRSDACQEAQGMRSDLGPAALVELGGVRVVLNSIRQQVFDTACFEAFGIDLRTCRIVVVKSQQHFYARFAPLASQVIYATPPGSTNLDLQTVTLKNVPRPIYPLDEPPFRAFGRHWTR
jgi:microcystin degradation protein MlrC